MHQASILMTAFVMLMGVAWVALYEFSDNTAEASEPAAVVEMVQ